ncbi:uncharacterized protein DDB_G0271670-like [Diabrotica virgifera virgifera]|uniref:Dentin sialophosphoprotein-like n=1 Tax=Diabrotica virgifera virgifera TaxID=50390 RepID=A0ABM5KCK5_DIAVI|nr:uncharacterized protein DDB_G0271670-like [Diabrotica virgifera virgifera]
MTGMDTAIRRKETYFTITRLDPGVSEKSLKKSIRSYTGIPEEEVDVRFLRTNKYGEQVATITVRPSKAEELRKYGSIKENTSDNKEYHTYVGESKPDTIQSIKRSRYDTDELLKNTLHEKVNIALSLNAENVGESNKDGSQSMKLTLSDAVEANVTDHESTSEKVTISNRFRSRSSSTSSSSSSFYSTYSSSSSSSSCSSLINEPSTSKQHTMVKPNYQISLINTDESDADLSDFDLTFQLDNNKNKVASSSESCASDSLLHSSNSELIKKTRKRLRNTSTWKQNVISKLRNT